VFDDYPNIVENPTLKLDTLDGPAWRAAAFSSDAGSLQRPISMLSFAVNTYFAGMDPVAMKATNVVIHGINALLVLGLVQLCSRSPRPASTRGAARGPRPSSPSRGRCIRSTR
jgi:hypothetical protein